MRRTLLAAIALVLIATGSAIAVKIYRNNFYDRPAPANYGYANYGNAGSGCGSRNCSLAYTGGSCCGSQGQGGAASIEQSKKLALDYYVKTYSDNDVTVEMKDYGCHQEAYILKSGKAIKRLSISGNRVYEIG